MMMFGTGLGGWGMTWMMLGSVVFLSLLVLGTVAVIRYSGGYRPNSAVDEVPPQEVLAQRFARGEIDEEEYVQRSHILSDNAVS